MTQRPERKLRTCPIFAEPGVDLWDNRDNMPWPTAGESLLSDTVGAEAYVFPLEKWVADDFERLGYFSMFFQEQARELVRNWLTSHDKPENVMYAVGFFYRHAIELRLKSIIASHKSFATLTLQEQKKALERHGLSNLWGSAKPLIAEYIEDSRMVDFERQLHELDTLDRGSDGFRYPFRFADKQGTRKPPLAGIAKKSFDNFVWILDGLCGWLATAEDAEEQYRG